jgi:hypothetical protein
VFAEQQYENNILSVAVSVNDDDCSSGSRPLWIIGVVVGGFILLVAAVLVVGYILHKLKVVNVFYAMMWFPRSTRYQKQKRELDSVTV